MQERRLENTFAPYQSCYCVQSEYSAWLVLTSDRHLCQNNFTHLRNPAIFVWKKRKAAVAWSLRTDGSTCSL